MKIAIVHDFLVQMGGAEKVVEILHGMFPDAPIFTSAYDRNAMPELYKQWDIRVSFLQRLPFKKSTHRYAFALYPIAFEAFDFQKFDLVLSSSSSFAKGIITPPETTHICYTHTPMRFAWDPAGYAESEQFPRIIRNALIWQLHRLRVWDTVAAGRVDHFIANSNAVAKRIEKYYRCPSQVVWPPVDTDRFQIVGDVGNYYIVVSRFVPYKRLDMAVEAFTRLKRPLKVVGTGRQMPALKAKAGPNIEFLGRVADADLPGLMARARAFIMPGEEDFGIAPVEANACGRPVVAYAAGGALDSQVHGETSILFAEQSVECLCDAVGELDGMDFDPQRIRAHARQFDTEVFKRSMAEAIARAHPALSRGLAVHRGAGVTSPTEPTFRQ